MPSILIMVSVIFQAKSFLNVRTCCLSLSFMTVNEESLCFGLSVGQKESISRLNFLNSQHL